MPTFVYIVRCSDNSLYTGSSENVAARIEKHNKGTGAKYTRSRRPVVLVYAEECESLSAALKREHQIKRSSRKNKEALIAGDMG